MAGGLAPLPSSRSSSLSSWALGLDNQPSAGRVRATRSSTARPTASPTSIRRHLRLRDVHARRERLRAPARLHERSRNSSRRSRPSASRSGTLKTWRCNLRQGCHVPRRIGVRLGRREVLHRPREQQVDQGAGGRELSVATAREPEERHDERPVRGHVPPQVAAGDVARRPGHAVLLHRPERYLRTRQAPLEHGLAGRNRPVQARQVHRRASRPCFEPNDDYWGTKAKTTNLIIRYYSKSSTMKLALQQGEIDMAFQTFTPTELTSLDEGEGHRGAQRERRASIRYLVVQRRRGRRRTTSPCGRRSPT